MKHSHHCHCGLREQFHRFRAGKLGLLGGVLVVGHLLFHVAECLILPAIFVGFSGHHHSESHEASAAELIETTFTNQVFYDSWLANSTPNITFATKVFYPDAQYFTELE